MVRKNSFKMVKLKDISPNRLNPRLEFSKGPLDELADSIEQMGLVQPLVLRPEEGGYEIVVGERRYRASQQAKLDRVPAIIGGYTDAEVIELNLAENLHRENLSDVEKGNCCKELKKQFPDRYPNNASLAKRLGVSASSVGAWIQVATDVPREIQEMVAPVEKRGMLVPEGKITSDIALQITRRIDEPDRRKRIARELAKRPLPVRMAREAVKEASAKPERSVEEVVDTIVEKQESKIVSETNTGVVLACPLCEGKMRLIHRDPKGHKLEEVFENG
jgi:ParB family chromosome partitioning protein